MRHYIILFILLIGLPSIALTQGLYKDNCYFDLVNSGKTKVNVFVNKGLTSVWLIDISARTLTQHQLEPTIMNPVAPVFDNNLSTRYLTKYCFNKLGKVDSILLANYHLAIPTGNTSLVDTIADTTVIIYSYPLLENWVMNRKYYQIKNGNRKLLRTDHYGYNDQKRLILLIEDEGRIQYYFTYNDNEQIETSTFLGTKIKYDYNSSGQLKSCESETYKILYEYNKDKLLIKEVISGNENRTTTYEYE
jgi:hypothetical protein